MATALIIGVDGQDGSYLAELLLGHGYRVIGWVPDNIPVTYTNIVSIQNQITLTGGRLDDQDGLKACLNEYQPDEVYNLASPSFPATSWESTVEIGDITALGPARLLEAIRLSPHPAHFYQASSSELFGNPIEVPQNENTPFHPRNPYGIAKLYAHWLTVRYREKFGLFAVSGILYNHESPRRSQEFVTRKISLGTAKIKAGMQKELLLGDLDARRDWGFAGDYVMAIWKMLHQDLPQDIVIGTGETHSVREFCEIAFNHLDLDYRDYVRQDPRFIRSPESAQLVADPTKAKQYLDWQPKISFDQLVKMMVEADYYKINSITQNNQAQ